MSTGSSSGTSSGGTTTGAVGCTIDGQFFPPRASNPLNAAQCCNPAISATAWLPLFTKAYSFPIGTPPATYGPNNGAIGDLSQDGIADVALGILATSPGDRFFLGSVWVYLSNDGGFDGPFIYREADGGSDTVIVGIAIADLNRDGLPDLIVTGNGLDIFLNLGGGRFGDPISVPEPSTACSGDASGSYDPVILDANADGWPDVAVACMYGTLLLLNDAQGDGALLPPQMISTSETYDGEAYELAAGDFNGDGYPDLAYIDYQQDSVWWLENRAGTFGAPVEILDAGGYETLDILSFRSGSGDTLVAQSVDQPLFGPNHVVNLNVFAPSADGPASLGVYQLDGGENGFAVDDLNGDGLPDLVCASSQSIDVVINRGNGLFGPPGRMQMPQTLPIYWVATGDFNGDGAADLATFHQDDVANLVNTWEIWINTCGSGAAALLDGGLPP